ncbi:hypothetical protein ACWIUD_09410 [Helicobacter sp. 23-1044]
MLCSFKFLFVAESVLILQCDFSENVLLDSANLCVFFEKFAESIKFCLLPA